MHEKMLPAPALIIINCWLAFLGYWLLSAFTVKATAERQSFSSSLSYRIPLLIGGYLLAAFRHPHLSQPVTPHTLVTAWVGAAVCVAGLGVAIWSRWKLGGNWSSDVRYKEGHELVQTGPYRFVRHPIYSGILLMCLGPAIQFGLLHYWLGVLVIGLGLWIKLQQEETVMLRHFPEYAGYRQRVKALVPFVV